MTQDLAAPTLARRVYRQAAWPAAVLLMALCVWHAGAAADSYLSPDTIDGAAPIDAVVLYWNGPRCQRSDKAVMIATKCGYSNIYWFRDGMESSRAATYPIDQ